MSMPHEMIVSEGFRPLKRSEYDELVRAGAFAGERVELLYGVIVRMAPQDPQHASPVRDLHERLTLALSGRAYVQCQLPFAAGHESEPEPDIAVIPRRDYRGMHPDRAFLVVEVAHTSHARDRMKADLYAASDVLEYWIVDVVRRAIEVHREPADGTYRTHRVVSPGDSVALLAFPDVTVDVASLFGS